MVDIVNLTPHDLVLYKECSKEEKGCKDGYRKIGTIAPAVSPNELPRCREIISSAGNLDLKEFGKFPVIKKTFGKIENLPPRKRGTRYYISSLAKACAPQDRNDLLTAGELLREGRDGKLNTSSGRIVGITKFSL